LALADEGRLCLIGDSHQCIYGFRGADPDGIQNIVGRVSASGKPFASCPLSVTFRCPTWHVLLAQQIVPGLEFLLEKDYGDLDCIDPEKVEDRLRPGDLVLARRNAPLYGMAAALQKKGVPYSIGRKAEAKDSRKEMNKILLFVQRFNPTSIQHLTRAVRDYDVKHQERLKNFQATAQEIHRHRNQVDTVLRLAEKADSLPGFLLLLNDIYGKSSFDGEVVRLCSVHSAKGLEADRVFILEPWALPLSHEWLQPWEVQQERNVVYVALTRSRKDLYLCGDLSPLLQECVEGSLVRARRK
jgi:DNA helicase-2/ATP-dependent DNA helicase PcrA